MQLSGIPTKFPIPWANAAGGSYIRAIPTLSQIGVPGRDGWASLTDGFVPLNMTPEGSGGVPPFGQDTNGILKQLSQWAQWQAAGGPVPWDSTFSAAIGGYPQGATVASATTLGTAYLCLVDNNLTNPDTGGAGWRQYAITGDLSLYSGSIYGLTMSNTPSAPTTGITASVGSCRDSTNRYTLNNAAPLGKLLTSTWAAGSGMGGRLTATALAAGQTWHFYALLNPSNGAVEFGFDQSPTTPTMTLPNAAGYTVWRRLGAVVLDAAATTIRAFYQIGDYFMLQTRSVDYASQANGGLVAYLRPITVPVGIIVEAFLVFQSTGTVNDTPYFSGVYNPAFGAPPAFGGSTQWAQIRRLAFKAPSGANVTYGYVVCSQLTDANANVYTRSSDTLDSIAIGVLGWRDQRGQFYPDP